MTYFKKNLRLLRKRKGLKQDELANQLGLKRWNVTAYERGVAKPPLNILLKIAGFFEQDLTQLLNADLSDEKSTEIPENNTTKHQNTPHNLSSKYEELQLFELQQRQKFHEDVNRIGNSLERILDLLKVFPGIIKSKQENKKASN